MIPHCLSPRSRGSQCPYRTSQRRLSSPEASPPPRPASTAAGSSRSFVTGQDIAPNIPTNFTNQRRISQWLAAQLELEGNSRSPTHADWLAARKALLAQEKEFTRLRDEAEPRTAENFHWEKVENRYVFEGPNGKETLADLFGGRSQLIVYHFMLGPSWKEGCPSCSYLGRSLRRPATIHLAHRAMSRWLVVSRATYL